MASLDLRPDLNLVLVQTAVFVSNLYVVKRFFVSPFLKLKEARLKETEGVKEKALLFQKEANALDSAINKKLKEALSEAQELRSSIEELAEEEQKKTLLLAKEKSEEEVNKVLAQVRDNLQAGRKQLAEESSRLVPKVCSLLLGAK